MELWDVYNVNRELTGRTMVRGNPIKPGDYHLVVHCCIFNLRGEMLIQQRQPFKDGWPNMWDVTVGGSSVSGEDSAAAIERELFEEIGLKLNFKNVRPHLSVNYDGGFDDFYLINKDVDLTSLKLQYEEVKAVKWATISEIYEKIDDGTFIPYYKSLIKAFFDMRHHYGTQTK